MFALVVPQIEIVCAMPSNRNYFTPSFIDYSNYPKQMVALCTQQTIWDLSWQDLEQSLKNGHLLGQEFPNTFGYLNAWLLRLGDNFHLTTDWDFLAETPEQEELFIVDNDQKRIAVMKNEHLRQLPYLGMKCDDAWVFQCMGSYHPLFEVFPPDVGNINPINYIQAVFPNKTKTIPLCSFRRTRQYDTFDCLYHAQRVEGGIMVFLREWERGIPYENTELNEYNIIMIPEDSDKVVHLGKTTGHPYLDNVRTLKRMRTQPSNIGIIRYHLQSRFRSIAVYHAYAHINDVKLSFRVVLPDTPNPEESLEKVFKSLGCLSQLTQQQAENLHTRISFVPLD